MIRSLSRPMRVLVIGSLALNLFGIGAIAADAIMDRDHHGGLFGHWLLPPFVPSGGSPAPAERLRVLIGVRTLVRFAWAC